MKRNQQIGWISGVLLGTVCSGLAATMPVYSIDIGHGTPRSGTIDGPYAQVGSWNKVALNSGGGSNTITVNNLLDGTGTATPGVSFVFNDNAANYAYFWSDTKATMSQDLGQHLNTTGNMNWKFTGLLANTSYYVWGAGGTGGLFAGPAIGTPGQPNGPKYAWGDDLIMTTDGTGALTGSWGDTADFSYCTLDCMQIQQVSPLLAARAGKDKSVSASSHSVQIGATPTATGGTPPYTYSWSPSPDLSSDTAPTPIASPVSTTTYTLTVTDSADPAATATDEVVVTFIAPPPNDNFANATLLPNNSGIRTGDTTIEATSETGEPAFLYGPAGSNYGLSVWYKWTCATDGTFVLRTAGSKNVGNAEWDVYVSIYDGAELGTLHELSHFDGGQAETAVQAVTAGSTYYIRLTWGGGPTGSAATDRDATNLHLEWSWTAPNTVVDINNASHPVTPADPNGPGINIDAEVGVGGNSGRLIGQTQTWWGSGGFSVPLDLNGNTLIIDTGGGNAMSCSGAISGNGIVRMNAGGADWLHIGGSTGNTYTGTTVLNSGPIKLKKSSGNALCGTITVQGTMSGNFPGTGNLVWSAPNQIADTSDVAVITSGAVLNLAGFSNTIASLNLVAGSSVETGNGGVLTASALTVGGSVMAAGTYTSSSPFVTGTGGLIVLPAGSPYEIWATAHVGGQSASEDFNNDGVSNGLAYFMGTAGTLAATTPAVVTTDTVKTVTWPRDPTAVVSSFMVQISDNLTTWTDIMPPNISIDESITTQVTYTLPTGATKKFCRLVVTP